MAKLLRPTEEGLREAVEILAGGGLVAFPTETVYGLGADASNPAAVSRVYEVKGRPRNQPLILHVSGMEMFLKCVHEVPEDAYRLAEVFWPGPLTLVLPKAGWVPKEVTGGGGMVGVRWPAHKVAKAIISMLDRPVVAPSANRSGRPSPTLPSHVMDDLGQLIDAVVDGGETLIGIESTVLDLTTDPPRVLRPGAVPVEEIVKVLGREVVISAAPRSEAPRYRPGKPLAVIECWEGRDVCEVLKEACGELGFTDPVVLVVDEVMGAVKECFTQVISLGSREEPLEVGRRLFRVLREAEGLGGDGIIALSLPSEGGLWVAISHRLREAASRVLNACSHFSPS